MNTSRLLVLSTGLLFAAAAYAADSKAIFEEHCAKCHGVDGKGQTKIGKKLGIRDYTDAKVQATFTDAEAFTAVKEGKKNAAGKLQMKPVEGLADEEITAVVAYVRSLKS